MKESLHTKINNVKKTKDINFYSFDIFDTLVTRKVATPTGIFALMQNCIKNNPDFPDFIKNDFYEIRVNSEQLARINAKRIKDSNEISFDEIYQTLQNNYGLSGENIDFLKKLEITTEIQNLVPITNNIKLLQNLIQDNCKVVLISDMYYSAKELRYILGHLNEIFKHITIYVSSDYAESKGNGNLYSIVQQIENVEFKNWIHLGDNNNADIKKAREKGISAIKFNPPELMPYEKRAFISSDLNSQCLVGAARLCRFNLPQIHSEKYIFGASFAAPLLYSYVNFIINQAKIRNFKKLYFIARDGFVPKIIADVIIKNKNLDIETKYIYGSRLAWRVPTEENYNSLIEIFFDEYKDKLSVDFLSYRLGIDNNLLKKYKKNYIKKLKDILLNDNGIRHQIIKQNSQKVDLLKKYLSQELDLNSEEIAFVDLLGSGRTQDLISSLINKKTYCFYFSVFPTNLNAHSSKIAYHKPFPYTHWIELLSKTTEGQTTGYSYATDNKIIPITETWKGEFLLEEWGLKDYYSGIKDFTHVITNSHIDLALNSYNFISKYLNYILNPDKTTAKIIGDIPYKMVGNEENVETCAPELNFWELLNIFIFCKKKKLETSLPTITLARSNITSKKLLKFIEKYPTIQKFLFNIYIHKGKKEAFIRVLGIKISLNRIFWRKKKNVKK